MPCVFAKREGCPNRASDIASPRLLSTILGQGLRLVSLSTALTGKDTEGLTLRTSDRLAVLEDCKPAHVVTKLRNSEALALDSAVTLPLVALRGRAQD